MLWLENHKIPPISDLLRKMQALRTRTAFLRVAMVSSSLRLGGAEKQAVYMARALFERGIGVQFFQLGEDGHYTNVLRRIGTPLAQIYHANRPLVILARLLKAFCQFQPHIMLAPQFGDLLFGGLAGRLCNSLNIGGLRSNGFYELNAHGRLSRWMLRSAHGLLANSHHGKQNLVSHGVTPNSITVLPNVIDLQEFDARTNASASFPANDRAVAVAVGSLQVSKRLDRFLDALAVARRHAPSLFGVIAGEDQGVRSSLERKAHELGLLPNHVSFLGECDNVPALLARSAFLVLTSDYEGFPNVILEAMAACLPVITTPAGDAERIVMDGKTGYVVNRNDIQDIAHRMVQLARCSELRARLGKEGRHRVAEEYVYERLTERLLGAFHGFAMQCGRRKLAAHLQHSFSANRSLALADQGVDKGLVHA